MADPRNLKTLAMRLEAFANDDQELEELLQVVGLDELRYLCVIAELLIAIGACQLLKDLEETTEDA